MHALKKEMETHSSILAWRIPGTEEPSGLPSMGSHRVPHGWSDLAEAAAAAAINKSTAITEGLPRWLSGKESACQCRRCKFDPWVGKISWRRKWLPTPVFLPAEFYGWRSLAGYNPWDQKEPPRIEQAWNTEPSSLKDDMWQAVGCTPLQSPFLTRRLRS